MREGDSLPAGWTLARLGDIAELKLGKMLSEKAYTNDLTQLPYLRNQNIRWFSIDTDDLKRMGFKHDEVPKFTLRPNDLLMCEGGEPGRCAVFRGHDEPLMYQKALHRIRPICDAFDPCFLQYAFRHFVDSGTVLPRFAETTIQHLPLEKLKEIAVLLPPRSEQRRIVAKIEELFSKLDAGVAALERVRAGLKRYRAAVLKAAVEGKLTADWRAKHRDAEPAAKLLDRILRDRRRKWEEAQLAKYAAAGKPPPNGWRDKYKEPAGPETSGLPELPEGWAWATVGQLVSRSEYGTSVKCDHDAPGPAVLRIPNIAKGRIDLDDLKRSTVSIDLEAEDALQAGDLLVCRTNGSISLIGKGAIVPETFSPPHAFASYLLRFRFAEVKTLPRWMHTFISSLQGRRFIEGHAASSAGQHNISLTTIHSMPLPLPPHAEQQEIVAEVERRLSIVDELEAEVATDLKRAARLRQSILKRAFAGRLVPQDPADEPAAKLLERVKVARERTKR